MRYRSLSYSCHIQNYLQGERRTLHFMNNKQLSQQVDEARVLQKAYNWSWSFDVDIKEIYLWIQWSIALKAA